MVTLQQNTKTVGCSAYWGGRGEWPIACAITRDSDCLERSNFRSIQRDLLALPAVKNWVGEACPVAIERFSHWAVGWCDYLVIDPACQEAVDRAEAIREKLEDYPVADENDFSELEMEEANQVWRDCYRPAERIAYIRKYRSQFEFRGFEDLLGCVRGNYFTGYASDLLTK